MALWPAYPAHAHARLIDAAPSANAFLGTPPARLQLLFDEELDEEGSQLRVFGPTGQRADRRDQQVDGVRMWISLQDQGPGVYRVRWKAVADDDKGVTQDAYTFNVSPQLPAGVPQITVLPPVANNGDPVTVAGSGFVPNSSVLLEVGDGAGFLAAASVYARGQFRVAAVLPADLPYGRQVVQATDTADNLATAAIQVPSGGGPVAAVSVAAEFEEDTITYTIRVENRSGYHLRGLVLGALIPESTRVLAEDLGQPDGVEAPEVGGGQVVWRGGRMSPHTIVGPFSFSVTSAAVADQAIVATIASVEFVHSASAPVFRGVARSAELAVQVAR